MKLSNIDKKVDELNRNWYRKVYRTIVSRARSRGLNREVIPFYVEIHHIFPKCLGGKDEDYNKVALTYKEHFICHMILTRLFPSNYWIHSSFYLMSHISVDENGKKTRKSVSAKLAAEFKEFSKEHPKPISEETRKKLSKSGKRRVVSEETRKKLSINNKGKHFLNDIQKQHLREINTGVNNPNYGKIRSKETREKASKSIKEAFLRKGGHSQETKEKISKKKLGISPKPESIEKAKKTRLKNGGWSVSENTRQKIGNSLRGRKHISEEVKQKMSSNYGFPVEYTSDLGVVYKFSSLTKAVQGLKEIGIVKSIKYVKSHCLTETNGFKFTGNSEMIKNPVIDEINNIEYSSLSECAEKLHITRSTLLDWINNHPEKGYKYKNK